MIKLSRQEKARQLHDNAMAAAEKAFFAKRAGDIDLAKTLIYEAYKNEKSAAESLSTQIDKEPSRSVLFRSAATLAYECGEYREAEKLISNGLFGNPPDEIANELRDLLEQVNFTRHLQNQNITLLEDEIQMSFVGNDIGKGFAPFNIFLSRMKDFERIIQRFRDRISKVPFKEQPKSISLLFIFICSKRRKLLSYTEVDQSNGITKHKHFERRKNHERQE